MPPRSLEPDQTAKLVERLANKCGKTVPSRLILEFIKARTPNRTLPLAARSKQTTTLMALIAYARVSTDEQTTAPPTGVLRRAGCSMIFEERA